jgi:hypothetical protein
MQPIPGMYSACQSSCLLHRTIRCCYALSLFEGEEDEMDADHETKGVYGFSAAVLETEKNFLSETVSGFWFFSDFSFFFFSL